MPYVVSIIICTHRRLSLLELAVESMSRQTTNKDLFEVIVVDNDSSPNETVKAIVEKYRKKINLRYVHEPVLGLSQARNTGNKNSTADYVGYMDDDAKAPENYVEQLLKIIHEQKPDFFGGPYYPYYLNPKPKWFKDEYETGKIAQKNGPLTSMQFLSGTNMIYKKHILETFKGFDVSFGMNGKTIAYGEETDLQIRIWDANPSVRAYYSTDLFQFHFVPLHKMSILNKMSRDFHVGYSQTYVWIKPTDIDSEKKQAFYKLFKFSFLIGKTFITLPFRNKNDFPSWKNLIYEKTPLYFRVTGQECRLIKDLFKSR